MTQLTSDFDNVFLDLPSNTNDGQSSNDCLSRTFPPSMSRVERDLNLSQIELPCENIMARTDLNQTNQKLL